MNDTLTVLPSTPHRWRPTRAGLVSLWRYWDETFRFHHGRLLLRGPNGSGKSMALELLLPFLLDADASPGRLTSAAKSRGGLFDRVMTGTSDASRVGFAWVEFGRDGATFTVGARIRASQATRKVDLDFFTTTLAVGRQLHLLDHTRTPLSRKALAEAIGDTGRVHGSADEHRAAVREVLFPGFSADRYASVVGALLALRKEKLSQNLDLDKLSTVLTEALPPLDDHDVTMVAEGFERLDRRKAELAALEGELAEVRQLAARQRDYARAVVVGQADAVRKAETRRDDVTRDERKAKDALDQVEAEAAAATTERGELDARANAIAVEIEAVKDSEAYRQGAALADLRKQATTLRAVAGSAQRRADDQAGAAARARDELDDARAAYDTATVNLDLAQRDLREAAGAVLADSVVDEAVALDGADEGERLVQAWTEMHRARVSEVRVALAAHDKAIDARTFAEQRVAADEAAVADRRARRDAARAAEHAAVAAYRHAVETWARGCTTIGASRVEGVLPRPADDPPAVTEAVTRLAAELAAADAVARSELGAEREQALAEQAEWRLERARWAEGGLVAPDAPAWRSPRHERAGAPLWQLVDVRPGVEPAAVDGIEAALTGAGLVDAWVRPDGRVDGGEWSDVFLTARPRGTRTLAEVLMPVPADDGAAVPPQVLERVLASVAVAHHAGAPGHDAALAEGATASHADAAGANRAAGAAGTAAEGATADAVRADGATGKGADGATAQHADAGRRDRAAGTAADSVDPTGDDVVVALDGTYRLGAAIGRGPRRPALLLGAAARERHRRERLAAIDAELAAVAARLAGLDRRHTDLVRHRAAVEAELAAVPPHIEVDAARADVARAVARLVEAEARFDEARVALTAAEGDVREALRVLTTLAARLGLPTDPAGLAAVEAALGDLARRSTTWARRRREHAAAGREHDRAGRRADDAARAAAAAKAEHADAHQAATEIEGRVSGLESSVGAEYTELVVRLAALDHERDAVRRRERHLSDLIPALQRRVGELAAALTAAASERVAAEQERTRAQARLVAGLGAFGADAGVEADGPFDTASAVLAAARRIVADHDRVDVEAHTIERLSERVRERVHLAQAALGGRVDVDRELADEGWWVLRTATGGLRRGVAQLAAALATELDEGRAELAADEERLFEQTLAGSVRRALAERIRLVNGLVDAINTQLAAVRTAAGEVQVRLRWDVDPEQLDAVKAARALLLRDPADLSDDERASLQAFVRARVDQARAELEANAPWEARLRETLDYRAWHRFTLLLAHRDWEGFQRATPARLQKLSTGERSIALHLPMIASLAAHYADDTGRPSTCPRLILLDELFAGVDAANRAQLFGTFTTWDLDAVFTSDHEWCQYATLDGIAIHHLHPATGAEPVTSTRFTWDGRRRRTDPTAA